MLHGGLGRQLLVSPFRYVGSHYDCLIGTQIVTMAPIQVRKYPKWPPYTCVGSHNNHNTGTQVVTVARIQESRQLLLPPYRKVGSHFGHHIGTQVVPVWPQYRSDASMATIQFRSHYGTTYAGSPLIMQHADTISAAYRPTYNVLESVYKPHLNNK